MKKYLVLIMVLFFVVFLLADDSRDIKKTLKKIDELYRSNSSFAEIEMIIKTPHWQRTLRIKGWSLGTKNTFMRILHPKKEKGFSTLRIGKEMWNYLPKTNKIMKIPPSMMMGSWMGSDFTNDDLVKQYTFLEDYHFEYTQFDQRKDLDYIKCIPREGKPIVWGYVMIAIDKKTDLPVWQKYYDDKGKLMREMFFKEVKVFSGRKVPSIMEILPGTKTGYKTVVKYIKAEFDIKINKEIFTARNLRKRI